MNAPNGLQRDFHLLRDTSGREFDFNTLKGRFRPFPEVYGADLHAEIVGNLRRNPPARRVLVEEMRAAWWRIRVEGKRQPSWVTHALHIMECAELLGDAGMGDFDLARLTDCLSSNCACDGCDLASGDRLVAMGPLS